MDCFAAAVAGFEEDDRLWLAYRGVSGPGASSSDSKDATSVDGERDRDRDREDSRCLS